jgi:hypothetical protein
VQKRQQQGSRGQLALFLALLVVFVPVLWTFFPTLGAHRPLLKIAVLSGLLVVAVIVLNEARKLNDALAEWMNLSDERSVPRRQAAARRSIVSILSHPPRSVPESFEFRVFLFDANTGRLAPTYEPHGVAAAQSWAPGHGVTGQAWTAQGFIECHGQQCHDATFGLDREEQEVHQNTNVVVAIPISTPAVGPVGVLTASRKVDSDYFTSAVGILELQDLAEAVGEILDRLGR